jgi:hypothetical protein
MPIVFWDTYRKLNFSLGLPKPPLCRQNAENIADRPADKTHSHTFLPRTHTHTHTHDVIGSTPADTKQSRVIALYWYNSKIDSNFLFPSLALSYFLISLYIFSFTSFHFPFLTYTLYFLHLSSFYLCLLINYSLICSDFAFNIQVSSATVYSIFFYMKSVFPYFIFPSCLSYLYSMAENIYVSL